MVYNKVTVKKTTPTWPHVKYLKGVVFMKKNYESTKMNAIRNEKAARQNRINGVNRSLEFCVDNKAMTLYALVKGASTPFTFGSLMG